MQDGADRGESVNHGHTMLKPTAASSARQDPAELAGGPAQAKCWSRDRFGQRCAEEPAPGVAAGPDLQRLLISVAQTC